MVYISPVSGRGATVTISQIRYFLEVAKEESYTKAAEKLFISHQALSSQIKALEKELGIRLLDRSNKRKTVLTDAGRVLFDAWNETEQIANAAIERARRMQEVEGKALVIGIQDMRFVRSYVVPIIRKLQDDPQEFRLEYRMGTPMEMFRMLDSGKVDMLIMISSDLNPKSKFQTALLSKNAMHLVAAVSKNHPLAKKKKITLKDLENETILMIDADYSGEAAKRFEKDLERYHMKIKRMKTFNGPRAINIAVETGMGVAILFDELLEEARDEIRTFPMDLENAKRTDMILVWKDKRLDETAVQLAKLAKQETD